MQLCEALRPEDLRDTELGRSCRRVNRLLESPSLGGESDHTSPSVGRIWNAQEVPVSFQVSEQIVDRLLRDPHPVRKLARTYSLEPRIAPEADVRRVQVVETRRNDSRIELITDPLPNDTEHCADVGASLAVEDGGIA